MKQKKCFHIVCRGAGKFWVNSRKIKVGIPTKHQRMTGAQTVNAASDD
jgi:hypothetical protein